MRVDRRFPRHGRRRLPARSLLLIGRCLPLIRHCLPLIRRCLLTGPVFLCLLRILGDAGTHEYEDENGNQSTKIQAISSLLKVILRENYFLPSSAGLETMSVPAMD